MKTNEIQVSICVIYRDEERNLERFLASILPLGAEMIFVDTGSRDRSREILLDHGIESHFFAWNDDFSAARNFSLKLAGKAYILVLDVDEEITAEDYDRLLKIAAASYAQGFFLDLINFSDDYREPGWHSSGQLPERFQRVAAGFSVSSMVRFFVNRPEIRFSGRIHEMVVQSLRENSLPIAATPIPIYHYGWTLTGRSASEIEAKKKVYRELHLSEWRSSGEPQAAYYYLVAIDDEREKIREALRMTGLFPGRAVFWEQLAMTAANLREWPRALAYAEKGLARHCGNEVLLAVKAVSLNETARPEAALSLLEKLLAVNPGHPVYILEKIKALLLARRRREALKTAENLPPNFPADLRRIVTGLIGTGIVT